MSNHHTRKAQRQKGGLRLEESNYAMPPTGYYEGEVYEGMPGTEGINSSRWISGKLNPTLTSVPGLGDDDEKLLKRIGIETTIQLIGVGMMITGNTENRGVPLVFYLRKVGLQYPVLVARMLIEKIDRILRRSIDYDEQPIVPAGPNGVNYPDIDVPELVLADYAEKFGLRLDEVSDMVQKRSDSLTKSYSEKHGITLDEVPAGKRSEYFKQIVSHLPAEIASFNRRKYAVKSFFNLRNAAAGAAVNTTTNAGAGASSAKLRRQTRRRRL